MGTYANYNITLAGDTTELTTLMGLITSGKTDLIDLDTAIIRGDADRYVIIVCQKTSWLGDWGFAELSMTFPNVVIVEKVFCDDCMFFGYIKTYKAGEVVENAIPLLFKNVITIDCDDDVLTHNINALTYNIMHGFKHGNIIVQGDEVTVYTSDEPFFAANDDDYSPSNSFKDCKVYCNWSLETGGLLWDAFYDNENQF